MIILLGLFSMVLFAQPTAMKMSAVTKLNVQIDTSQQVVVNKDVPKLLADKETEVQALLDTIVSTKKALQAQKEVSESIIQHIKDGTLSFLDLINWLYIVIFVIIAWLINDTSEATNTGIWLNWFAKIPKGLRTFIIGLLLAMAFYWMFSYNTRLDVFGLFCSLIFGMVVYKIGIDQIFAYISSNWLKLKFNK